MAALLSLEVNSSREECQKSNKEELIRRVSRMQAMMRGALVRRAFLKARSEYEDIGREIGSLDSCEGTESFDFDWPSAFICKPHFKPAKDQQNDVLERLSERGWRKSSRSQQPDSLQHQQHTQESLQPHSSSVPLAPPPVSTPQASSTTSPHQSSEASPYHSASFQSSSSFSSHSSEQSSRSISSSASSVHPDQSHPEGNEGTQPHLELDKKFVSNMDETERLNEQLVLQGDLNGEDRTTNRETVDGTGHSASQSNFEAEKGASTRLGDSPRRLGDSPEQSGKRMQDVHSEMPSGMTGEPNPSSSVERQRLHETDLTLVSSIEASSLDLSESDRESLFGSDAHSDNVLTHRTLKNVEQTQNEGDSTWQGQRSSRDQVDHSEAGHPSRASSSLHGNSSNTIASESDISSARANVNPSCSHDASQSASSTHKASETRRNIPDASKLSCDKVPIHKETLRDNDGSITDIPLSESPRSNIDERQTASQEPESITSHSGLRYPDFPKERCLTKRRAAGPCLDRQGGASHDSTLQSQDASVAADMTSIWSSDHSDSDDEPPSPTPDVDKLQEMRSNAAMELLWIQQAIESRKNYLRLKSKMGHDGSASGE